MSYIPRDRKLKVKWRMALPVFVLFVLVIYAVAFYIMPHKETKISSFTVCDLDEEQSVELLNKKNDATFEVVDYSVYGESLGFYTSPYDGVSNDELASKTLKLNNLCNGKSIQLTNDNAIDQKITLHDIPAGFYTVNVIDNLVEKRLVYQNKLDIPTITTIPRNRKIKEVQVYGDQDLLKDYKIHWDKNYLFIGVNTIPMKSREQKKQEVDVFLDPYGMNTDFQHVADKGNRGFDLQEYQEMYVAAEIMKKELEAYGLRVAISRDNVDDEANAAYGEKGRFAQAYARNAKYYLSLRMNGSDQSPENRGVEIWHSVHASDILGKHIMYGLEKNLGMVASNVIASETSGVMPSFVDKEIFDTNIYLRETGGRATFAARYSELSKTENQSFQNAFGMHALEIDYAYVSNPEDAQFWKEHREAIVKQSAASFAEGLNVQRSKK